MSIVYYFPKVRFSTDIDDRLIEAHADIFEKCVKDAFSRQGDFQVFGFIPRGVLNNRGLHIEIDKRERYKRPIPHLTLKHGHRVLTDWLATEGKNYNGRYWETFKADNSGSGGAPGASPGGANPLSIAFGAIAQRRSGKTAAISSGLTQAWQQAMIYGFSIVNVLDNASELSPLPSGDIIPGELIGHRMWIVKDNLLRSAYFDHIGWTSEPMLSAKPGDHNQTGYHAFKDKTDLHFLSYTAACNEAHIIAIGTVALWGEVVEHQLGYRAEFAQIRSIDQVRLQRGFDWPHWLEEGMLSELRTAYNLNPGPEAQNQEK